jgi:hypothetical protein
VKDDPLGWLGAVDALRDLGERLARDARVADHSPAEIDVAVKVFGVIMAAYLTHLWAEPDHPAFLPSVGYYQMYGSPNPDTVYRNAAIDGTGEYLITGHRGTAPEVSIMPLGRPAAGGVQTFPAFDLDDLAIDDDGTFEVLLSATPRPSARNWWRLDPDMRTLMLRSVSDRWGDHTDPRLAIVRLDTLPRRARTNPHVLESKFRSYATITERMVMSGMSRVATLRNNGVVNALTTVDYSAAGGGLAEQWYQEGCFAISEGEVLLIETALDSACRAFSLSLTDAALSTIDWTNAQSSLNRTQAVIDDDGVLRIAVAADDPGIANWLDTTGHRFGALQFRWTDTPNAPKSTLRVMPLNTLSDALPPSTQRVTPAERAATIRSRQIGSQLRTRW